MAPLGEENGAVYMGGGMGSLKAKMFQVRRKKRRLRRCRSCGDQAAKIKLRRSLAMVHVHITSEVNRCDVAGVFTQV